MALACTFQQFDPVPWSGRYDRIPGDGSVFHLRSQPGKNRIWPMAERKSDGEKSDYWFQENTAIRLLAEAVRRVQLRFNGAEGGSFTINEWGQVLVPSGAGDRRRFLVGALAGDWSLLDPDDRSARVSLDDDDGLDCGDSWDRPYVGLPYHLSKGSRIYFVHRAPHRDDVQYPPRQDQDLIGALRKVRHWGSVKFVVNPFGLVLTKRPTRQWHEEKWDPVYVGRIDYQQWFAKEVT